MGWSQVGVFIKYGSYSLSSGVSYSKISVFKSNWCHAMIFCILINFYKALISIRIILQTWWFPTMTADSRSIISCLWYPHGWYKCKCLLYLLSVKRCQWHRWRMVNHSQSDKMAHMVAFFCHSKKKGLILIYSNGLWIGSAVHNVTPMLNPLSWKLFSLKRKHKFHSMSLWLWSSTHEFQPFGPISQMLTYNDFVSAMSNIITTVCLSARPW